MSAKSIAQALAEQQAPQPMPVPAQNPLMPDPALEQRVAPVAYPVNPLVLAIAQKFGLLNLIRNTQNQKEDLLQGIQ